MSRIFVDTEFTNLPWTGHSQLLWVGLADDDGHSWSVINAEVRIDEHASEFTRNHPRHDALWNREVHRLVAAVEHRRG